jgi:hypothetical protein
MFVSMYYNYSCLIVHCHITDVFLLADPLVPTKSTTLETNLQLDHCRQPNIGKKFEVNPAGLK